MYRQKIKHLLYEHQNHIAVLKADEEAAVAQTREEGAAREAALAEDKMAFRQQLWAQVQRRLVSAIASCSQEQ